MTFSQLLRHVREVTLAAYTHQELPFEQLARVLEKELNVTRSSLFKVLLVYQNLNFHSLELRGLTFAPFDINQTEAGEKLTPTTFDLILNLRELSTKLTGTVTFSVDTYDSNSITSLMESFRSLLESMVVDKNRPIAQNFKIGLGQVL
jgi:non-ribosomal peptide synthetase component F